MKAVIIKANKEREVVEFSPETCYTTLRDAVGGLIDCVSLPSQGLDLWVNDEGLLEGLPINPVASALWYGEGYLKEPQPLVGDVIITGVADDEGNTQGLTDEQVQGLLDYDKEIIFL